MYLEPSLIFTLISAVAVSLGIMLAFEKSECKSLKSRIDELEVINGELEKNLRNCVDYLKKEQSKIELSKKNIFNNN